MGGTFVPPSLISSRAAAASRACASRVGINPACIAGAAAAKKPKRAGSFRDGEQPTKRLRAEEHGGDAAAVKPEEAMAFEERERIADLLLSLVQPGAGDPAGSCSDRVLPLPASVVEFLEEHKSGSVGWDDEIEIDVHALGDDALCGIRSRVSAYAQQQRGHHVDGALSARKNSVSHESPRPEDPAKLQPSAGGNTIRERLSKARSFTQAIRRRDIQRLRAAARRELEQVVRTVEFNDPFIDPRDVLK